MRKMNKEEFMKSLILDKRENPKILAVMQVLPLRRLERNWHGELRLVEKSQRDCINLRSLVEKKLVM